MTVIISASWISKMLLNKKILFQRTILDVPILIFLGSMLISTVFSIDFRTSLLGYYSRFNGGLLSLICYSILYWGIVSNFNPKEALNLVKVSLVSGFLASLYGIAQHFGIDKNIWIQDVQNRVFSTFGQPNWMAAWLVAMIPMTWSLSILSTIDTEKRKSDLKFQKPLIWVFCFLILFVALLFTKSRSGIIAMAFSTTVYWLVTIILSYRIDKSAKKIFKIFLIFNLSSLIIIAIVGTPWTPSVGNLINKIETLPPVQPIEQKAQGPLLEIGGSSSTEIRKIVWKGAIDLWKKYPIFGTGVETFAYSYYETRPVEHNLVSEWDFLYNKAHNEYLNFAATTGSIGLLSYFVLIFSIIFVLLITGNHNHKVKIPIKKSDIVFLSGEFDISIKNIALLSGFTSILITNFFGFSVVPVNLLFFTFPAFAIIFTTKSETQFQITGKDDKVLRIPLLLIWSFFIFLLVKVVNYWRADIYYSNSEKFSSSGSIQSAFDSIEKAIKLTPNEALYQDEEASTLATVALYFNKSEEPDRAKKMAVSAMDTSLKALKLSPRNINIQRNRARIAISLSEINPLYIIEAENTLKSAIQYAPTEAKLVHNLGLVYFRKGELDKAIETLNSAIKLKPNYKEARYAIAIVYEERKEHDKAIQELEYILNQIDPNDNNIKEYLKTLKSS